MAWFACSSTMSPTVTNFKTDETVTVMPRCPAKVTNFGASVSLSYVFLFFLFKLVVVDKGTAFQWKTVFFLCLTRTYAVPATVDSHVLPMRPKRITRVFGKPLWITHDLYRNCPQSCPLTGLKRGIREFFGKAMFCLIFRHAVIYLYKTATCNALTR